MRHLLGTAVVLALSATLWAQVTVTAPANATWTAYVQTDGDRFTEDAATPLAPGKTTQLKLPGEPSGLTVFIADSARNRITSKPIPASGNLDWRPNDADFKNLFRVRVDVRHKAEPATNGLLRAKVGSVTRETLLTPEDSGTVTLFNLPPGQLELAFTYKVGGETVTQGNIKQVLTASANIPGFVISLDKAPTGTASTPPPANAPASGNAPPQNAPSLPVGTAPAAPAPNRVGSLLAALVTGLIAAGAIAAFLFWALKNRREDVEKGLNSLGIGDNQTTDSGGDPALQDPTYNKAKAPLDRIVLDPTNAPVNPAPVAATAPAPAQPRLIFEGRAFPIAEGITVIGRDQGIAAELPDASSISRRHASLQRKNGVTLLEDHASTNGTFVNGTKISTATTLRPGDTVIIGAVSFTYTE